MILKQNDDPVCIDFGRFIQNQKRSAKNYSQFSYLEQESGSRLVERLDYMKFLDPKRILHLGSKTSDLSCEIRRKFKDAKIYDLELVYPRLNSGKDLIKNNADITEDQSFYDSHKNSDKPGYRPEDRPEDKHRYKPEYNPLDKPGYRPEDRPEDKPGYKSGDKSGDKSYGKATNSHFFIQADLEKLPFQDCKFDLIISNQALHFYDLSSVIKDCFRVLKDGGLFLFSSLGPDSFKELRSAWSETQDRFSHVHRFYDMHIIGDILKKARFLDPVMDCQWVDFKYRNIEQLFYELKGMGEQYIDVNRRKSLTGKSLWNNMLDAYPKSDDGFYPVCLEYIFGHAIKPDSKDLRASSMKNGVARVAVSNIDKII